MLASTLIARTGQDQPHPRAELSEAAYLETEIPDVTTREKENT